MRSSDPIAVRIRHAMTIRGVATYAVLGVMSATRKARLEDLMSTAGTCALTEELQRLAAALFVPPTWLAATDEATAAAAAADPAWSWARAVTAPSTTQLPPAPDDTDPVMRWQRELAICWRVYAAKGRPDAQDRAVEAMLTQPTADGRPWPRFHRSVMMQAVTDFTPAQQHALGLVLCPHLTPPYADVAASARTLAHLPCTTPMNALCPPEWPLEPDSGSYGRLLDKLVRAREGRLIGKPVAGDRSPDLISDQVVEVMVATFRCRFPDDAELDLLAAVRVYRHFRKRAYIGNDNGHEVWELWDSLPAEVILSRDDLKRKYTRAGLPIDNLMQHINDLEHERRIRVRRSSGQFWVVVPTAASSG